MEELKCRNCGENLEADCTRCPECQELAIDNILKLADEATRLLETLVDDKNSDIAASVLQYKFLPESILDRLEKRASTDETLREKVFASPHCPHELKGKLVSKPMSRAVQASASKPTTKTKRLIKTGATCCKNCRWFNRSGYDVTFYCKKTGRMLGKEGVEISIDCSSFSPSGA